MNELPKHIEHKFFSEYRRVSLDREEIYFIRDILEMHFMRHQDHPDPLLPIACKCIYLEGENHSRC